MLPKVSYNAYASSANSMQIRPKSVNFGMNFEKGEINAAYEIANALRFLGGERSELVASFLYHIANSLKQSGSPHDVAVLLERVAEVAEKGKLPAETNTLVKDLAAKEP